MSYSLTIGSVECEIKSRSLRISEVANGRHTFTAEVIEPETFRVEVGTELLVEINGTTIFGGTVNQPTERGFSRYGGERLITRVSVLGFHALADQVTITETIPAGTLKEALEVVEPYLAPRGVSLDAGQANGPNLPELVYVGKKVAEVLDEFTKLTGEAGTPFLWEIDYDKTLRMIEPGTVSAPFNINTATDSRVRGDVVVEHSETEYANRIVVLAGTGSKYITAETHDGDGSTREFVLNVPALSFPRGAVWVSFDGEPSNPYPLGVYGVDPYIWTYEAATNTLHQDTTQTTITANGWVEVDYIGQFPVRVQAPLAEDEPSAEQTARGYVVERVFVEPDIFDITHAQSLANGYLAQFLSAGSKKVKYVTFDGGLHPGQTQTIVCAERDVSGTHLITDVSIEDTAVPNILKYTITAIAGTTYTGSWRDFYRRQRGGSGASSSSGGGSATPGGTDITQLLSHPLARRWAAITAHAAGLANIGVDSAFSTTGTPTTVAEAGFAGRRYTSGTTSGDAGGVSTSSIVFFPTITDWVGYIRMRTGSDISSLRLWCGFSSFAFVNADSAPIASRHSAAFRYSTPGGDGGWVGFVQAGVGATFSVTGTVAPIAADTEYLLRIRVSGNGTEVHFSVDGGEEQTLTTNVPDTTEALRFHIVAFTNTTAARYVDFSVMYIEYRGADRVLEGAIE